MEGGGGRPDRASARPQIIGLLPTHAYTRAGFPPEIERIFRAKVHPRTLEKKAERAGATNVASPPTQRDDSGNVATCGYTPDAVEIVKKVDALVEQGASVREAAKKIAESVGGKACTVRQAYAREKERAAYQHLPAPTPSPDKGEAANVPSRSQNGLGQRHGERSKTFVLR